MSADGAFAFSSAPSPEELARFELNDFGNAMRFIRQTGGRIEDDGSIDTSASRVLWLRRRGWIVFNGRHWDLDHGEALARREAAKVAPGLYQQIPIKQQSLPNLSPRAQQAMWDFAVQSGNSGKINALLNVAAAYLEVDIDAFDTDPLALNCDNGVVRFVRSPEGAKVVFRPGHEPGDRMTRIAAAAYDPAAEAPLFRGVVEFAQPKAAERDYLQRVLGYMATGSVEEQKFFVFQGKGGDGKSTIVNAVRKTLGTYATVVAVETFLDTGLRRGSEASPDIAALAGDSRMLCAGEPPSGSKLATGAIKAFTGGGSMKARELREGLFEFEPIGKPLIECNRRPAINDTDDGIWRRLKILLFEHQVPPDQVDGALPRKLMDERAGILAWLVKGVLAWLDRGLKDEPDSVRLAIEDYRKGSNPFVQWFEARVERDESARVRASELYADYKSWMEDNGHDKPMSQRAFGGALGDLQIILAGKDGAGKVMRRGARLVTPTEEASRAAPPADGAGGPSGSGDFGDPGDGFGDDDWGGR